MATRDLDRLAQRVKAHRLALYPSRTEAARAAGISKDTWKKVEDGLPVLDVKLARVDKALDWVTGSCILIAEGGDPFLAAEFLPHTPSAPELSEDEARKAAYEAARAAMPRAPIGEVDDFVDRFVKGLRRTGQVKGDD